ncbi:MAG: Ig-like domain-containing protein [Pseudomonadota bacterium]|nr:Ig-like domain-containing protein [Pseudomonadota bacterium]
MSVLSYAVRGADGVVARGETSSLSNNVIFAGNVKHISLNLSPSEVVGYIQNGNDLLIELASGEVINLQGYFNGGAEDKELYLSKEGEFHQVDLGTPIGNQFPATYEVADISGKWSQYDELTFLDLERVEPVVAPLVAPALGGLGAAGAAAIGGIAVVGGGGGGGGGGNGDGPIVPTVDNPDVDRIIGGTGPDGTEVSGTGEAGSTVTVTVGDETIETTVGDDGTWSVAFDPTTLPADGVYASTVKVVAPDGTEYDLAGPNVDIDTTAPDAVVTEGTLSVGEVVNAEEHADGHVITGTGEAGATIDVTINGTTHTTTVGGDGSWSVSFATGEIATGEYETEVTVTSTDERGNSVTTTDTLSVDTVAPEIAMGTVEGDNTISASELSDGVTLTGTGEAGASLTIQIQGESYTTTVGDNGTWSLDLSATSIQTGTYDETVTLTATDAAGNSHSESYTLHVDTEGSVTLGAPIEDDNVANAAEVADGITLTGTAEAGSSVVVNFQGINRTVTADSDGNWSASFAAGEIQSGTYDSQITVTATDPVGNTSTTTGTVHVDTEIDASIDDGQLGGDDTANAAEVAAGFTLTGTADSGASVQVTLHGVTKTVTAGADGSWSATYTSSEIPSGEYDAVVSVTATDTAGNSTTVSDTIRVDTDVSVEVDDDQAGGDNIANAAEVAGGLAFTGIADAGEQVQVSFQGVTKTVTADGSGNWTANFASSEIPQGEYTGTLTATVTDAAGNTATSSQEVQVDTATQATVSVQPAVGDATINAAEMQSGVTLDGTGEPGSTISVEIGGVVRSTTVTESGTWSVTYENGSLPEGTYTTTANVTATDLAGNTATASSQFSVDTEVNNPLISSVTFSDDDVTAVSVESSDQDISIHGLNSNGTSSAFNATEVNLTPDESLFALNPAASDGTNLVIAGEDAAGNQSDTLLILDDNATNAGTLDHASLGNFQIEGIELDYAADVNLTLTESQIRDLSDTSDTLTVHGGSDDTLTVNGAQATGDTVNIEGEDYDVYTVGDDGVTLIVDQDINMVI